MEAKLKKLRESAYNFLSINKSLCDKKSIDVLIEELMVYQIELELQNVSLMEAYSHLEAINRKYKDLYDYAPVGYFTLNENGIINDVNMAGCELLGIDKDKLINSLFMHYVAVNTRQIFSQYFKRIVECENIKSCDIEMNKYDNGTFLARLNARIYSDLHCNAQYLITISDISYKYVAIENKKLRELNEEAEKNNQAKDIYLATLSHELRSPITAILCWVQTLKNKQQDGKLQNIGLKAIEENILIQKHLVNDLLDVSSIVLGKISIQLEAVDLIQIIQSSIDSMQPHSKEKNVEILFVTKVIEFILPLDVGRMRQVFYNLIMNAIKFSSPKGLVQVLVEEGNNDIRIMIKDNGVGIAPDVLPRVFEQFFQGFPHIKSHGGLGIGLTLVHSLLELQGGSIEVASEGLNKGSTFTIIFKQNS